MKAIINGKRYDTETARFLCSLADSHVSRDFSWHDTSLYRTSKGAFFVAGEGGPMSRWEGRVTSWHGDDLRALLAREAAAAIRGRLTRDLKGGTMKAFLVGGSVRDRLLGLPVRDRDWVVVGATSLASPTIPSASCARRASPPNSRASPSPPRPWR